MYRIATSLLFLLLVSCRTEPNTPPAKALQTKAPASSIAAKAEAKPEALTYIERIKGDATKPLPMVVAVHGLGDNPESFARVFDAYDGPMRIIVLQGITPFHDGYSWFDLSSGLDSEDATRGVAFAAEQIESTLEELPNKYPTVGKPILTGFSQGGMLSFTVAARRPDLIQAAIPMAGFLPKKLMPTEKPTSIAPIYALHGDADARIAISLAKESVAALSALGYTATIESFAGVGHSLPLEVRAALYMKMHSLTLPPEKSCELISDCDAEIGLRCASGKGTANCIRPYTKSGEHLLGVCSIACL
jgi:phospholipase/carboxylesterase